MKWNQWWLNHKMCAINTLHITGEFHAHFSTPDSKVHGANMGPPGPCRPQMGPMLAPWILQSGTLMCAKWAHLCTPGLVAHGWIWFLCVEIDVDYMQSIFLKILTLFCYAFLWLSVLHGCIWSIYPYLSGFLHWHWIIMWSPYAMPVKQS